MHVHVPQAWHDELSSRVDCARCSKFAGQRTIRTEGTNRVSLNRDGLIGYDTGMLNIDDIHMADEHVDPLTRHSLTRQEEDGGVYGKAGDLHFRPSRSMEVTKRAPLVCAQFCAIEPAPQVWQSTTISNVAIGSGSNSLLGRNAGGRGWPL